MVSWYPLLKFAFVLIAGLQPILQKEKRNRIIVVSCNTYIVMGIVDQFIKVLGGLVRGIIKKY